MLKKIVSTAKNCFNKAVSFAFNVKTAVSALIGLGVASTASAQATLPAAASAAITEIGDLGGLLIDAAWPIVGAITVGFVLIKLFKRAASKV